MELGRLQRPQPHYIFHFSRYKKINECRYNISVRTTKTIDSICRTVTQNKTLNDRFLQKVVRKHRKTWREAERREVGSGDSGQDVVICVGVKQFPKRIYLK